MRNYAPLIRIVIDTGTESGRGLFRGIAHYNQVKGGWAIWKDLTYDRYLRDGSALPKKEPHRFDGFIAFINRNDELEYCKSHIKKNTPAVVSMSYQTNSPNVLYFKTDDFAVGQKIAEYFIHNNFTNFAFCGCPSRKMSVDRQNGFQNAIKKHHMAKYEFFNFNTKQITMDDAEVKQLTKWLTSLPKPAAIMTCNDDRGQDVLRACRAAKLLVPELISIVGVDNDEITCNIYTTSLSSLRLNLESAGYSAAEQLDRILHKKKPEYREIIIKPADIVERKSSNTMATRNEIVVAAVNYIKQNSAKNMGLDEIAEAVGVSRRSLQRKFKTFLGRSVLDETQTIRCRKIAEILIYTNLSIMQIAYAMGFNGIENISRYFKQVYGMRPLEYRKTFGLPQDI